MLGFALLLVAAYLVGSIPAAYLLSRWTRGVDIRLVGSGNVGTTNVMTVVSKRVGILVAIFDVGKGMLAVFVGDMMGLPLYQQVLAGAAAIAGHNWPVFLGFSGGRGVLTTLGIVLFLAPNLAILLLLIAGIGRLFRQVAIATVLDTVLLPVFSWLSHTAIIGWLFGRSLGTEERLPVTLAYTGIFLITAIRRLTAPRVPISATVPTRELILYRFFFDRDIKDREAWVHRAIPKAESGDRRKTGKTG
ncbi:MAG: glycerol-3-phosphate acyltransferase [Chloroflexi bacterium]|nr:glycerol-3-phosphate acyltransferase [Chloroflexota bacterium]